MLSLLKNSPQMTILMEMKAAIHARLTLERLPTGTAEVVQLLSNSINC